MVIDWTPDEPLADPKPVIAWLRETHRTTATSGQSYLGICRHLSEKKATLVFAPSEADFDTWLDSYEHLFATCELSALNTLH